MSQSDPLIHQRRFCRCPISDIFIAYVLAQNIRVEEDLIDPLFNSSEKRLDLHE